MDVFFLVVCVQNRYLVYLKFVAMDLKIDGASTVFAVIQAPEKINYTSPRLLHMNKISTLSLGVALKLRWHLIN